MFILKKLSILSASLLIAAGLSACEQKGSAEKLGAKIDQTVESAKEAMKK